GGGLSPEVGDAIAEVGEQAAEQRKRETEDVMRIADDTVDKRASEPVDGERTCDLQRLIGPQVRLELVGCGCSEAHLRRRHIGRPDPRPDVDRAGSGEQSALSPTHLSPSLPGFLDGAWLAEPLAVYVEDRIAPDHNALLDRKSTRLNSSHTV